MQDGEPPDQHLSQFVELAAQLASSLRVKRASGDLKATKWLAKRTKAIYKSLAIVLAAR